MSVADRKGARRRQKALIQKGHAPRPGAKPVHPQAPKAKK